MDYDIFSKGASSLINAGTNIANTILDFKNYNYQKDLQKQIFQREDSAIQRRVADAEAAGFNKWSVMGEGSSAGQVVNTTAPQVRDVSGGVLDTLAQVYNLAIQKNSAELAKTQNEQAKWNLGSEQWRSILSIAESMNDLGLPYVVGEEFGTPFITSPTEKEMQEYLETGYSSSLPSHSRWSYESPIWKKTQFEYKNEIADFISKNLNMDKSEFDIQLKDLETQLRGKENKYFGILQALKFISGIVNVGLGVYGKLK